MAIPRPEYPRPHFDRSHSWISGNGAWQFVADPRHELDLEAVQQAAGRSILVPFPWETAASGVGEHWLSRGWYRRLLTIPADWSGQRIVLHFGAVHHAATIWVNGVKVGEHVGGQVPFEFDVTDALDGSTAEVVVRVDAPTDKRGIVHGKQRSIPRDGYDDCAFTPSSGIWQPVWLECRPATWITAVRLHPSSSLTGIEVEVEAAGAHVAGSVVRIDVLEDNVAAELIVLNGAVHTTLVLSSPRLWRPESPHLYTVRVSLHSSDGEDVVTATTGLRRVTVHGPEIRLNGERLYVRGVLDQGYWPDSGITAPTDAAFVRDLELARDAGFSVVRKHLKLEDPRFLHHADRLGMLVWAEPASTGRFCATAAAEFEAQIAPMVERDGNHPCIVIWGLYNEEWGLDWDLPGDPVKQDAVRRAYRRLKQLDPSRPVVDNSGWAHLETDLVDWHVYMSDPIAWRNLVAGIADGSVSRFPVHIAPDVVVDKHLMADGGPAPIVPNLNSEYAGGFTSAQRGWHQRWQTQELRRHDGLSGYVYTELYDIEHEMAGVYTERRTSKDLGGADPALAHAITTLVLDIDPIEPGRDVVAADGRVEILVHVSHHGAAALDGYLTTRWVEVGAPVTTATAAAAVAGGLTRRGPDVTVKPFQLSETVHVSTELPPNLAAARLVISFVAEESVAAVAVVDVHRH